MDPKTNCICLGKANIFCTIIVLVAIEKWLEKRHYDGAENELKLLREREHFLCHYSVFAVEKCVEKVTIMGPTTN